jgi:hypothetical protein
MVTQIEHELGHAIEGPLDPQWVAAVGRETGIRLDRRQVFQLRDGGTHLGAELQTGSPPD